MCQAVFWVLKFCFSLFCWAVVIHLRFFIRQVKFLIFMMSSTLNFHWNSKKLPKNQSHKYLLLCFLLDILEFCFLHQLQLMLWYTAVKVQIFFVFGCLVLFLHGYPVVARFTYCWSLAWRILSITLLVCEMSPIVW